MNDWRNFPIIAIQYDLDNEEVCLRLESGYVMIIKLGRTINEASIELDGAIDWQKQVVSKYGSE